MLSAPSRLLPAPLRRLRLVPENPDALARPPGRPPVDLPATTTRPTTHRPASTRPGAADGPGESQLGLPTHPGRPGRSRPSGRRLQATPRQAPPGTLRCQSSNQTHRD